MSSSGQNLIQSKYSEHNITLPFEVKLGGSEQEWNSWSRDTHSGAYKWEHVTLYLRVAA